MPARPRRRPRLAWWTPAITAALLCGASARARAMSCVDHIAETMSLDLEEVRRDGAVVPAPSVLVVNEAMNSAQRGQWLLLWQRDTMRQAKFFALTEPDPPLPAVARYIDARASEALDTPCGYDAPFVPIQPGRYTFREEHADGSTTSADLADPIVTVLPGRDRLTLEFGLDGSRFLAIYRVLCASFPRDGEGVCAPTLPSPTPWRTEAPTTPVAAPDGEPPPPAPVEVVPPAVATAPPGAGCGACAVPRREPSDGRALSMVLLGVALLGARRGRAPVAPRR